MISTTLSLLILATKSYDTAVNIYTVAVTTTEKKLEQEKEFQQQFSEF
jgi:hypothetical protein